MRITKFRGKVKYNGNHKFSGDWIYGYYRSNENGNAFITETLDEMDNYIFDETEIDENTVGQFTGLHDKNGKEIYEGDIVQHLYEFSDVTDRYLIDYDEDDLSYVFQNISNKNRFIALEDLYDEDYGDYAIEVIGNIYENPELLERS